ncbi:MAG: glycosyltransferase family 4 protein [Bdellovibrionota bacterium]
MKVLMLGWEYPPHINGGLGTACLGITTALSKIRSIDLTFALPKVYGDENAHHMTLVEPKKNKKNKKNKIRKDVISLKFRERIKKFTFPEILNPYWTSEEYEKFLEDYKIKTLNEINKSGFKLLRSCIDFDFKNFIKTNKLGRQVVKYASNVVDFFSDDDFDIIHAHDWMTVLPAVALSKLTSKPLVLHIHSLEYDRSGVCNDYFVNLIEKLGTTYAHRIIAVSEYTKNVIVREHGVCKEKISVVYNAMMFNKINKYELPKELKKYKIVLFLGRITWQKGPEFFVEASKKVLEKVRNVKFIVAGDGDLAPMMVKKTIELQVHDHFIFTGFLKKKEVERVFSISDVFVMPSFSEPFGIVALEAIYYGSAIVISKQSGCSEVIRSALKCDYWDSDKLGEHIIYLLNNNEARKELIEESKKELASLSWDKSAKEIYKVYRSVLS